MTHQNPISGMSGEPESIYPSLRPLSWSKNKLTCLRINAHMIMTMKENNYHQKTMSNKLQYYF